MYTPTFPHQHAANPESHTHILAVNPTLGVIALSALAGRGEPPRSGAAAPGTPLLSLHIDEAVATARDTDTRLILPEDRKSTRLNSSHVAISYAVFCLKKKKKFNKHTC